MGLLDLESLPQPQRPQSPGGFLGGQQQPGQQQQGQADPNQQQMDPAMQGGDPAMQQQPPAQPPQEPGVGHIPINSADEERINLPVANPEEQKLAEIMQVNITDAVIDEEVQAVIDRQVGQSQDKPKAMGQLAAQLLSTEARLATQMKGKIDPAIFVPIGRHAVTEIMDMAIASGAYQVESDESEARDAYKAMMHGVQTFTQQNPDMVDQNQVNHLGQQLRSGALDK